MNTAPKRVIISGGTGFIGKHLENKISKIKECEIYILSRQSNDTSDKSDKKSKHVQVDYQCFKNLKEEFKKINPTHVYHLASSRNRDKSNDFESDIKTSKDTIVDLNCINSCLNIPNLQNLIYLGTNDVFENIYEINFGTNINPKNDYALKKAYVCQYLINLQSKKQLNSSIVFPTIIYGPGQKKDMLIPKIIDSLINMKEFEIKNPTIYKDFIYIDDFISFLIEFLSPIDLNNNIHFAFSGKPITLESLFNKILKNFPNKLDHNISLRKCVKSSDLKINPPKANKIFSKTSLKLGLSNTVHFMKSNNSK